MAGLQGFRTTQPLCVGRWAIWHICVCLVEHELPCLRIQDHEPRDAGHAILRLEALDASVPVREGVEVFHLLEIGREGRLVLVGRPENNWQRRLRLCGWRGGGRGAAKAT